MERLAVAPGIKNPHPRQKFRQYPVARRAPLLSPADRGLSDRIRRGDLRRAIGDLAGFHRVIARLAETLIRLRLPSRFHEELYPQWLVPRRLHNIPICDRYRREPPATKQSTAYPPPCPEFFWRKKSSISNGRPLPASSERTPLSISARKALSLSTCEINLRPICS